MVTSAVQTDFDQMRQRIEGSPTANITTAKDGTKLVTLGLMPVPEGVKSQNVKGTIVPLTIHFDETGKADSIYLTNQIRSGGTHYTMNSRIFESLMGVAGREGGDFIAKLARAYGDTRFEADHYDANQALGARNPSEAKRSALLQDAIHAIAQGFERAGAHVKMDVPQGLGADPTRVIPGGYNASRIVCGVPSVDPRFRH